jgi:hypothetical protein
MLEIVKKNNNCRNITILFMQHIYNLIIQQVKPDTTSFAFLKS